MLGIGSLNKLVKRKRLVATAFVATSSRQVIRWTLLELAMSWADDGDISYGCNIDRFGVVVLVTMHLTCTTNEVISSYLF